MVGTVQNQDSYMQSVAAQRPYFFDHLPSLVERVFEEYLPVDGTAIARVMSYRAEDADYLIMDEGSMIVTAEEVRRTTCVNIAGSASASSSC